MSSNSDNPPRASLLGLPLELRQIVYEHVFTPSGPLRSSLDQLPRELRYHVWSHTSQSQKKDFVESNPLNRLSKRREHSGHEYWWHVVFHLFGNASASTTKDGNVNEGGGDGGGEAGVVEHHAHFASLFSLPYVCKAIRYDLRVIVAALPPIGQIRFGFYDFSREDLIVWINALGDRTLSHLRKFEISGYGKCKSTTYRNGHLYSGWHGGRGPCSFHEDGVLACNRRCYSRDSNTRKGLCFRGVVVELDRFEDNLSERERFHDEENALSQKTLRVANVSVQDQEKFNDEQKPILEKSLRVHNVHVEERLDRVKEELSAEKQTMKEALEMMRFVRINVYGYSSCKGGGWGKCYRKDPLDGFFDEQGKFGVRKETFFRVLEAVNDAGDT